MSIDSSWHQCDCGYEDTFQGRRSDEAKCADCGSRFLRQLTYSEAKTRFVRINTFKKRQNPTIFKEKVV